MSIYGNYITKPVQEAENHIQNLDSIMYSLESVAYNEYLHTTSLLESCLDESEKQYLEEKSQILLEVSFKDIKDKIVRVFKFLVEKIKQLLQRIKNFFNTKKKTKAKEQMNKVEKEDVTADTFSIPRRITVNTNIDNIESDTVEEPKETSLSLTSNDQPKEPEKDISKEAIFNQNIKFINKIMDNRFLYFDCYNYMSKDARNNIHGLRNYVDDSISSLDDFLTYSDPEKAKEYDMDPERANRYANKKLNNAKNMFPNNYMNFFIIKPEYMSRYKDGNIIYTLGKGEKRQASANTYNLNETIDNDLKDRLEKNKLKIESVKDFDQNYKKIEKFIADQVEIDDYDYLSSIISNLSSQINEISQYIYKYLSKVELKKGSYDNRMKSYPVKGFEELNKFLRGLITILQNDISAVSILIKFESRRFSSACNAANVLASLVLK